MSKHEKQLNSFLADFRYEISPGIHTRHQCKCGRRSTRAGKCWECLVEEYLEESN